MPPFKIFKRLSKKTLRSQSTPASEAPSEDIQDGEKDVSGPPDSSRLTMPPVPALPPSAKTSATPESYREDTPVNPETEQDGSQNHSLAFTQAESIGEELLEGGKFLAATLGELRAPWMEANRDVRETRLGRSAEATGACL